MVTIGTVPGERLAGLSADLFHKVKKGRITLDEFDLFLKRQNPFQSNFVSLLEEVGSPVKVPAIRRFDPREKFVNSCEDGLLIEHLGPNFEWNVLEMDNSLEENVRAAVLRKRKLPKSLPGQTLLEELSGADLKYISDARISLAHAFSFLKSASGSRDGYIFIVVSGGGVWRMDAKWYSSWVIDLDPIDSHPSWYEGKIFVSY